MANATTEAAAGLDSLIETALSDSPLAGVVIPGGAKNVLDHDRKHFASRLKRVVDNRNALLNWIRRNLVEGIDYGRIHVYGPNSRTPCHNGSRCTIDFHWSKPSLWKAGAEKILALLGLTPRWPGLADLERRIGDRGRAPDEVMLRCFAVDPKGQILGEGAGSRSVRTDGSLNKALKMAKKSAMIDCVITLGGLSEIFSQDVADDELTYLTPDVAELSEVCTVGPFTGQRWSRIPNAGLRDIQEHPDVPDDIKRVATDTLLQREETGEPDPEADYPAAAETEMSLSRAAEAVQAARTIEALEQTWAAIPDRFRPALTSVYERNRKVLA